MPIGGFDFGDFLGIALGAGEEITLENAEEAKLLKNSPSVMTPDPMMTEEEALDIFATAEVMGIGRGKSVRRGVLENESLAMADDLINDLSDGSSTSLKSRKTQANNPYSSVTGRLKCPFEQWIKDVCTGRKTIHDPVGGANSYGKSKY